MCLGIPGKVEEITSNSLSLLSYESAPSYFDGKVNFGGIIKKVNLTCVPEVKVGDYVIVHAGIAITIVDSDEAQKVFEHLKEMENFENQNDYNLD